MVILWARAQTVPVIPVVAADAGGRDACQRLLPDEMTDLAAGQGLWVPDATSERDVARLVARLRDMEGAEAERSRIAVTAVQHVTITAAHGSGGLPWLDAAAPAGTSHRPLGSWAEVVRTSRADVLWSGRPSARPAARRPARRHR